MNEKAYKEGWDAFHDPSTSSTLTEEGMEIVICPYDVETNLDEYDSWWEGYYDAEINLLEQTMIW